ncbi:MAG: CcdB family protein [Alphaproteobacteria bacterium]
MASQFDLIRNTTGYRENAVPYFVIVQSDLVYDIQTKVVIPLHRPSTYKPANRLNPIFDIDGESLTLMTQEIVGLEPGMVGPIIGTVEAHHDAIIAAIDFLISGF